MQLEALLARKNYVGGLVVIKRDAESESECLVRHSLMDYPRNNLIFITETDFQL